MTDNAEAPAGPDIVVRLRALADDLDMWDDLAPIDTARDAAKAIEYLRDANARLIAENNTLRAELRAARGEEG